MKPPRFDYEAPRDLDAALGLLAERGADGKVLAGGQSLVPLPNFRLARPDVLIDVNLLLAGNMVGTVHMVMPLGELKLQLVSPPLRGGAR